MVDRRITGFGAKEGLLALFVIASAALIIFPLAVRTQNRNLLLNESGRMRRLFFSLTLYETVNDSMPAPSLVTVRTFDPNLADYRSGLDPFANVQSPSTGFPCDPGLNSEEKSPFRISFSYLQNFVRAGKVSIKPWSEAKFDNQLGELADEWYGSIEPGAPFQAQVGGRLLRINADGSVYVLQDRGGPKPLGDAQDLFIKR